MIIVELTDNIKNTTCAIQASDILAVDTQGTLPITVVTLRGGRQYQVRETVHEVVTKMLTGPYRSE